MGRRPTRLELKRTALGVSVLHDIDLLPGEIGVTVVGEPDLHISYVECRKAIGNARPESDLARLRLARRFLLRRWLASHTYDDLAERARPIGLPVDHVLHPGTDWVQERVLGDVLDLGLGIVGLEPGWPDTVVLVPPDVLDAAGLNATDWWWSARRYLDRMGAMASHRLDRDGPQAVLRPMGDCDVVTLLCSRIFRTSICVGTPSAMRAAVVPMRNRGWLDIVRIDPAFGPAAAAATTEIERGFTRPLLITADEVVQTAAGGRPQVALADPAPPRELFRPLLYR
ncbi:MAG: hypothetical protein ABR520_12940 [Mycobacteriales bacterium]|nr:hypothetical protein [Frankia sp.]